MPMYSKYPGETDQAFRARMAQQSEKPQGGTATEGAKGMVGAITGGFLGKLAAKAAAKRAAPKAPVKPAPPVGTMVSPPDAMAGVKKAAAEAARRKQAGNRPPSGPRY